MKKIICGILLMICQSTWAACFQIKTSKHNCATQTDGVLVGTAGYPSQVMLIPCALLGENRQDILLLLLNAIVAENVTKVEAYIKFIQEEKLDILSKRHPLEAFDERMRYVRPRDRYFISTPLTLVVLQSSDYRYLDVMDTEPQKKKLTIMNLLLKAGADPNSDALTAESKFDSVGLPLQNCIRYHRDPEMIKMLLVAGATAEADLIVWPHKAILSPIFFEKTGIYLTLAGIDLNKESPTFARIDLNKESPKINFAKKIYNNIKNKDFTSKIMQELQRYLKKFHPRYPNAQWSNPNRNAIECAMEHFEELYKLDCSMTNKESIPFKESESFWFQCCCLLNQIR